MKISKWLCVTTLFISVLSLYACDGGGDGSDSTTFSGGSGLSVDTNDVALTLDRDGPAGLYNLNISWTSFNVSEIKAGAPPGASLPSWLSLSFSGRSGSSMRLIMDVNNNSMTTGVYHTKVRVVSYNLNTPMDYADINVTATIVTRPVVSPTSLSFNMVEGQLPAPQTVTFTRDSGSVTIYPTSFFWSANPWASLSINNNSAEVMLNNRAVSLTPGYYVENLVINYNGGQNSIPIGLTVEPALDVPANVVFNITPTSTAVDKSRTITVASKTGNIINWQASFDKAWLTVSPTSGGTLSPDNLSLTLDQMQIDVMRRGVYTGIITVSSADSGVSTVTVPLTLNIDVPEVSYVAPYMAQSGKSEEVIIRGAGFQTLTNPVVKFGDNSPLSINVISDTEIRATHDALSAADYTVQVSGDQGTIRSFAALRVYDPVAYPKSWNTAPYNIGLSGLIFDPVRGLLYKTVAGTSSGSIGALSFNGTVWTTADSVSDTRLPHSAVAMTPDGAFFYAQAITDTFRIDADTFAVETLYDNGAPGIDASFKQAAFANDGSMLVTSSYSSYSYIYKYDPQLSHRSTLYSNTLKPADRIAGASLDGSRVYFVSQSRSVPVLYYDASTDQLVTMSVTEQSSHLSVDRRGDKFIVGNSVYDGDGNLLGSLPITALTNVITLDGQTAYTVETDPTGVTIRKFDLASADGVGGFTEAGNGTFISGPEIAGPVMIISPDASMLFILSSSGGDLVLPAP